MTAARALLPNRVRAKLSNAIRKAELTFAGTQQFELSNLRSTSPDELRSIFTSTAADEGWASDLTAIQSQMPFEDIPAGVCPGERRALYYLAAALRPRSVLEIGTHIAASTICIAAALKRFGEPHASVTTVDILDVNNPDEGAFAGLGQNQPLAMVEALNQRVQFRKAPALEFLQGCSPGSYDMIFLDGDHTPLAVYREISASLRILRPGGVILLHDFYPGNRPIYHSSTVTTGPFTASERIRKEVAGLQFCPLGVLPWETKDGKNIGSLAMVSTTSVSGGPVDISSPRT